MKEGKSYFDEVVKDKIVVEKKMMGDTIDRPSVTEVDDE